MPDNSLEIQPISDNHIRLIDNYLSNGGNKVKAYLEVYPDVAYHTAAGAYNKVQALPQVKEYLKTRQTELKEAANIKSIEILNTLKTWLYSDPSQFIGLTPDDIKALPPDVRQCIQSIDHKKKTYTDRRGEKITEEHIKVQLVDKTKALEMINKHIGFYSEDNKQRSTNINIDKLNINVLNALLKAHEDNEQG